MERALEAVAPPGIGGGPRLPWETLSFTGFVLGTAPEWPWLAAPRLAPLPPLPRLAGDSSSFTEEIRKAKRRRIYDSVVEAVSDQSRSLQLAKWLELLELAIFSSWVGQQISKYVGEGKTSEDVLELRAGGLRPPKYTDFVHARHRPPPLC